MSAARSSTFDSSARGPDPGAGFSCRAVRAGLAALLALVVVAVAAPAASAQAQAWPCSSFGYLFQTRAAATDTEIVQVDLATGVQTQIGTTQSSTASDVVLNAVGYNAVDGFYYGMQGARNVATDPYTWTLARLHPDGTLEDLGVPTGPGGTMASNPANYPIGEVDANGHYWAVDNAGDTWYEVDLTTPTPTVLDSGAFTPPAGITSMGNDWAAINGALYVPGNGADGSFHLIRFDPATGVFSDVGVVGAGGFGAVFADASGYFYGSQNADGDIYRIDTTTLQTIIASDEGEASPGNDGARCANAVVPTITVTKTVDGRVRAGDQFTVGLVRPSGTVATSATTSGTGTTASTVNFPASQGQTYTITDAMAAGSPTPLGEYAKSIACTDANGTPAPVGGSGPTWTLLVANPTFYTCNVTNRGAADVVTEKSASPSPVVPGEDVTFSVKVTNNGPSTAVNEQITDVLPAEVTFSSASPGCAEAAGTVTCAVGDLAPSESKTVTITGRVASSLSKCLRNTATATGSTFDPDTNNNSSTICTPIEGKSDLSMRKDPSSPRVTAGGQVMYTLVVRNNGPSDDPGVQVSDPLAAGLTLVSAKPSQGTCTTTNNTVACDMGALKDGGSAQILVTANVPNTTGCITNTARVLGAHEDPTPENNQDTAQICVDPTPQPTFDLTVDKTANDRDVLVGQRVTYRVVVRNNGPDAAPNAVVPDTLNAPVSVVSVKATQGSCERRIPMRCELGTIAAGESVTITVVAKHRDATGCSPRQRNAASAVASGTDSNPANNIDSVDICVRKVKVKVSKVASRQTVSAGETFSYQIRVRNPTKGEARNVKVCDRLPSGLLYVSSAPRAKRQGGQRCWTIKTLSAGKSRTFKVTVHAARGANGRKTNTATVSSPDTRPARARDGVRVLGVATPVTG